MKLLKPRLAVTGYCMKTHRHGFTEDTVKLLKPRLAVTGYCMKTHRYVFTEDSEVRLAVAT